MNGGECLVGQGWQSSGQNTAAAMPRCSSSLEQEWDGALMHETRWQRALNKMEVMEILTRRFLVDGDSGAGRLIGIDLLLASPMVGGGFQGLTGDSN
jgi:hypothetical protein